MLVFFLPLTLHVFHFVGNVSRLSPLLGDNLDYLVLVLDELSVGYQTEGFLLVRLSTARRGFRVRRIPGSVYPFQHRLWTFSGVKCYAGAYSRFCRVLPDESLQRFSL